MLIKSFDGNTMRITQTFKYLYRFTCGEFSVEDFEPSDPPPPQMSHRTKRQSTISEITDRFGMLCETRREF
jgi:hypothetical protein